jgi:Lectin C-type domain
LRLLPKQNRTKSFLFFFIGFAITACNAIAGIEAGKPALCVDGAPSDIAHCEEAAPLDAGGSVDAENGTMSSSGGNTSCEAPWEWDDPVTGRCYLQESKPREWAVAEQRCVDIGGHLVAIDSVDELERLAKRVDPDVWIGGTDATTEGEFVWTNGQPWLFASWKNGLPTDANGDRDCVTLDTSGGDFLVFDARPCTEKRAYVCERSPNNR